MIYVVPSFLVETNSEIVRGKSYSCLAFVEDVQRSRQRICAFCWEDNLFHACIFLAFTYINAASNSSHYIPTFLRAVQQMCSSSTLIEWNVFYQLSSPANMKLFHSKPHELLDQRRRK
jgi:hypothetical protein